MTQESNEDLARAKLRETVKKITEAEKDLARNAIDYAAKASLTSTGDFMPKDWCGR